MRYFFLVILSIFISQNIDAQIYEVGIFAGGSNFIGDVGATNYISPNQPALGAIFTDTSQFGLTGSQFGNIFIPQAILAVVSALIIPW